MMEKCKANKRWETTSLNHLCDIYTGNSISDSIKNNYTDKNEAHPYLSSKDIDAITSKANYNNGLWIKNDDCNFKVAKTGSTLMCIEGGSAGKKKTFLRQDVSFVNKLCCFYSNSLNSKYLFYWLSNPEFEQLFNSNISGLIGGVTVGKIKSFKITYPSDINEQQKIADFLDEKVKEIDNAIEKTKETIELYKKMKKAVIEDFVFKRKEKNAIDTGIYYIKKIPTYWGITKVKYVLDENGLKTKTGLEEPLSVSQKYGLIPTKNMDSVPLQMADYSKCKIVHKNDLVFNKLKAHLGVFYHSDYEGIVSPDYAVYQSLNINVEYLELLFKTKEYISEFIKRSTGVGQGFMRLYTEPLFSMYIPYPSIKEQKEIVNSIRQKHEEIDNLINYKEKIVNDLTCYKKSLIYEYVTGKKEVK